MLRVSFRNLLVRDAFKVVPLELAMSGFWFVFSAWSSLSVPRLVIFHYDPKSKRLVINKCVKLVVREIRAELVAVKIRGKNKSRCNLKQTRNTRDIN